MNTRATAANLAQAAKDLAVSWQLARSSWRDAKSVEFESRFLDPLPSAIARASTAIEELDAVLRKAQRDCE